LLTTGIYCFELRRLSICL